MKAKLVVMTIECGFLNSLRIGDTGKLVFLSKRWTTVIGQTLQTGLELVANEKKKNNFQTLKKALAGAWGAGGGLVDRAADSGPYDPSSIPLGEKKENKQKRGWGWPI